MNEPEKKRIGKPIYFADESDFATPEDVNKALMVVAQGMGQVRINLEKKVGQVEKDSKAGDETIATHLSLVSKDLAQHKADTQNAIKNIQLKKGDSGKDADEDAIVEKLLNQIKLPEAQAELQITRDTAEDIRNKLELLEGDERLNISAISGMEDLLKQFKPNNNGELILAANRHLYQLLDVQVAGIVSGQYLMWNGINWVPGSGGTGSFTLTTTGTSGPATYIGGVLNIPQYTGGTTYTFSTGLTNTSGTITVNTSQNITTLSNLTVAGFVQTTSGGVLSSAALTSGQVTIALGFTPYNATNPSGYISANQTITLSGHVTGSGTTAITTSTASKMILQGTTDATASAAQFLGALTTGIVKNTTTTGVLSIAVAGTDYQAPISLTTTGTSGAATFASNTLNIPQYQGAITLTTTGTSGAATLVGTTLNIPQYSGSGGTPGGSTTQIQYNNAGAFGGISGVTSNGTTITYASGALILSGATSGTTILNAAAVAGSTTITLPAVTDTVAVLGTAQTFTAAQTISIASATAFQVGPNGATNPTLNIVTNVASQVTGLSITGAATTGGVTLTTTDSGANSGMAFQVKGTGGFSFGPNTAGNFAAQGGGGSAFTYSTSGTQRIAVGQSTAIFLQNISLSTAASVRFGFTGAADTTLTLSTEAPSVYFNSGQTRQHATGALALQRDFRITGSTHAFVAASTLTNAAAFSVDGPSPAGTSATITNSSAIYVPTSTLTTGVTNSYGINISASTGASNNYAAIFTGAMQINLGSDATGDMYYRNSGGNFIRLGIGSSNQVLTVSGGVPVWSANPLANRTAVSDTAYTVLATDYLVVYTTLTATRAVTLPSAATVTGQFFIIKDETGNAGTSNLTIVGTVDGATNKTVSSAYGDIRVYSNGTAFFTW